MVTQSETKTDEIPALPPEWGGTANGQGVSFPGDWKCSKIRLWRWSHNSVNVLKNIELYTLARLTLRYIN